MYLPFVMKCHRINPSEDKSSMFFNVTFFESCWAVWAVRDVGLLSAFLWCRELENSPNVCWVLLTQSQRKKVVLPAGPVLWAPWIKSLKTPSQFQDCCLIAASLHILNLQKLKLEIFLWWLTWRRSGRTEMLSVNDNNVVLNLANFYLQDTKMTFMLPGERKDLNDGIFIFPTPLQSIKHKHKCCGELYNNPEGVYF